MAYASSTDLSTYISDSDLAQLTDDTVLGGGTTNSVTVARALGDGADEIDSYIACRYDLPLSSPYPGILININCILAVWVLMLRQQTAAESLIEGWRDQVREARKKLGLIRDGKMDLDVGQSSPPGTDDDSAPTFEGETRVFTRTGFSGW